MLRIKVVVEKVEVGPRYTGRDEVATSLAERTVAEIADDRVAIVERLHELPQFAELVMRVAGPVFEAVAHEQLTALLGEVGATLTHRLRTWADRTSEKSEAA